LILLPNHFMVILHSTKLCCGKTIKSNPKPPKEEIKKKKLCGRAKKRKQYNKVFFNNNKHLPSITNPNYRILVDPINFLISRSSHEKYISKIKNEIFEKKKKIIATEEYWCSLLMEDNNIFNPIVDLTAQGTNNTLLLNGPLLHQIKDSVIQENEIGTIIRLLISILRDGNTIQSIAHSGIVNLLFKKLPIIIKNHLDLKNFLILLNENVSLLGNIDSNSKNLQYIANGLLSIRRECNFAKSALYNLFITIFRDRQFGISKTTDKLGFAICREFKKAHLRDICMISWYNKHHHRCYQPHLPALGTPYKRPHRRNRNKRHGRITMTEPSVIPYPPYIWPKRWAKCSLINQHNYKHIKSYNPDGSYFVLPGKRG